VASVAIAVTSATETFVLWLQQMNSRVGSVKVVSMGNAVPISTSWRPLGRTVPPVLLVTFR